MAEPVASITGVVKGAGTGLQWSGCGLAAACRPASPAQGTMTRRGPCGLRRLSSSSSTIPPTRLPSNLRGCRTAVPAISSSEAAVHPGLMREPPSSGSRDKKRPSQTVIMSNLGRTATRTQRGGR